MKLRQSQQGFSHVLIVAFFALAIAGISGFTFYRLYNHGNLGTSVYDQCAGKDDVQLCLHSVPRTIGYTDTVRISVTLANKGGQVHTWSGSSSCDSGPNLVINDTPPIRACTDDIRGFQLVPGDSDTQDVELSGADLKSGANTIEVRWAGITSPKMTVKQAGPAKGDTAKTDTCYGSEDDEPYCASISVIIKKSYYSDTSTCGDLTRYFSSLDIKPQEKLCLGSSGLLFFSVPKQDAGKWVAKLSAIPQVEEARESD